MEKQYTIKEATQEEVTKFNEGLTKLCDDLGIKVKATPKFRMQSDGTFVVEGNMTLFHLIELPDEETKTD